MHINLSPEIEQYLQGKVLSGFYSNSSEVIRDAIRHMWEDDSKLERLRSAIKIGDDEIAMGKYIQYTPELLEEITTEAIANHKAGKQVDPDVI